MHRTLNHNPPTDRVVAHEMVHLLHAQNTYYGDPTGDGSSSAKWLKEGLAEFIHGADDRVFSILGANPSDGEITSLINAIGTGNESWSTSEQYASSYLAARYLDYEIKQAGHKSRHQAHDAMDERPVRCKCRCSSQWF